MSTFDLQDKNAFEQFIGATTCKLELTNNKGETAIMELEPLDIKYFGEISYVQSRWPQPKVLNPHEVKAGREPRYESDETFLARVKKDDYAVYGDMMELLVTWIQQSYKDIPKQALQKLLYIHGGKFVTEFMKLHSDMDDETGEKKQLNEFIKQKREQLSHETSNTPTKTNTTE